MKVIRTKTPVTYGGRNRETSLIAISTSVEWQEHLGRYLTVIRDYKVVDIVNPAPGQPLKNYIPINTITKPKEQKRMDDVFDFLGNDILAGRKDFTGKLRNFQVKELLLEVQENPVYGTVADDWEIVDTDTEVAV